MHIQRRLEADCLLGVEVWRCLMRTGRRDGGGGAELGWEKRFVMSNAAGGLTGRGVVEEGSYLV